MRGDARFNRVGETLAIDGECAAGGNRRVTRARDDDRIQARQFFFHESDGVLEGGAAQRIAADEFGEPSGVMRRSAALWTHLVKIDINAGIRRLPCRFASRETTTDNGKPIKHLESPLL